MDMSHCFLPVVLQNDMLDVLCLLHKIYIDNSLNIEGHIALFLTGSITLKLQLICSIVYTCYGYSGITELLTWKKTTESD